MKFNKLFSVVFVLALLVGLTGTPVRAASVLYVSPTTILGLDCSDWVHACMLSEALAKASSGDEIWVREGTHYPTIGSDRTISFELIDGVEIYGGFAGTETLRSQRDWETNATILSGDIGTLDDSSDNSYHVVTIDGNISAVLDGFQIVAGNANGADTLSYDAGGGIFNFEGDPTLRNLIIAENKAKSAGGGMSLIYGNPTLTNVIFSTNSAKRGGGIYLGDSAILTSVIFTNNSASEKGGGMYNNQSSPTLSNVTFQSNEAGYGGGGMYNFGPTSNPSLTNVTFLGNHAGVNGGGIYNLGNLILTNATFSYNTAEDHGGGVINFSDSSLALTNVTFSGNGADHGGGIYNFNNYLTLINVIVADSIAGGDCFTTGTVFLNAATKNNLIENGSDSCGLTNGINGNIVGVDPKLGPLANNGGFNQTHALLSGSPAIDTGDSTACPATDQRDYSRPRDGDRNGSSICDIGAVEFGSIIVTNDNDSGAGSLRQAIADASVGDSVVFDDNYNIYLASTLIINKDLTIDGRERNITISGDTDNSGSPDVQVMYINAGVTATLDTLTITKGTATDGGGINNQGMLTIRNSTFSENNANSNGGGIYNSDTLTITSSTFSGNSASSNGGGVYNYSANGTCIDASMVDISNSTFSGNSASSGGGFKNHNGVASLSYDTFTANSSGGGVGSYNDATTCTTIGYSIIAGNTGFDVEADNTTQRYDSLGYNIIGVAGSNVDFSQEFNASDDQTGIDPKLGALADNGGPTQTHALLTGSPAINAGYDTACEYDTNNLDQRGMERPQETHCDIGAYEYYPGPDNDFFDFVKEIKTISYTDEISTTVATSSLTDPDLSSCNITGKGEATVWYKIDAASNTALSFDTLGSKYDTFIAIWEGTNLNDLRFVACNDDTGGSKQSAVAIRVTGGKTYYIEIGQP